MKVLSSIAKTAPENIAFIATWGSTEAARRGEPIGPAAAKNALWGLGFSIAVPLVTEAIKAGISTAAFEAAAIQDPTPGIGTQNSGGTAAYDLATDPLTCVFASWSNRETEFQVKEIMIVKMS